MTIDPRDYWLNNNGPPYLGPTGLHAWADAILATAQTETAQAIGTPETPVRAALEAVLAAVGVGDEAVAALIANAESQTRAALDADFVSQVEHQQVLTSETTTSTTYTDLETPGPSVTIEVPPSGVVRVDLRARVANTTAGTFAFMGFALSGENTAAAADEYALGLQSPGGNTMWQVGIPFIIAGLNPGETTFTCKYRVTNGTGAFQRRGIIVTTMP